MELKMFGDARRKKKIFLEVVCAFDTIAKDMILDELEKATLIEMSWRQKSKALLLRGRTPLTPC
jgi:hypothetical protein